MANVTIEQYEDNQAIVGTDLTEIYQPTSGGIRREKKVTEAEKQTYYQGTLPARITTLETYNQTASSTELSFDSLTIDAFSIKKNSNSDILCTAVWNGVPLSGTGIVFTLPTTSFIIRDGAANTVTMNTATFTVSDFSINGNRVNFKITETNKFTSLNIGPLGSVINGTGCKLTIT